MPTFIIPMRGEVMVVQTRPSAWNYLATIVVGVLLLPLFGVGLLFLAWVYVCIKTTCYVATNMRVICKTGWLNIQTTEVWIADIRGVNVTRNLMQRIIGTGDIAIGTAATEKAEITIQGVVAPEDFVAKVNAQRR